MDIYTLSDTFLPKDSIDEFVSIIWTERYSTAGEVQLVVPATKEMIDRLIPDTYLALRGTKEIMILETQSIENRLLTVTGRTFVTFLDQRYAWFRNPASSAPDPTARIIDYTDAAKSPAHFIASVVNQMVIATTAFTGEYAAADLTWDFEKIPALTLGTYDTTQPVKRLSIPIGPLYQGISQIAAAEGVGISLYLDSADPIVGYSLKFTTYLGKDRTSSQGTNPVVRLVPEMDHIDDLKELRSNALYKNVAYVYYQGTITKHLAEPALPEPQGLKRRVLITDPQDQPVGRKVIVRYQQPGSFGMHGNYTKIVVGAPEIAAFRDQNAKNAFANANYIRSVDGQVSPKNDYKLGVDYGLGDIIELQGLTGVISKSRITEYIRSQDQTGEKQYPTIEVIS